MNSHSYLDTPFKINWEEIKNGQGYWSYNKVEIFRDDLKIGEYTRNYSSLVKTTFYPFQHQNKWYALYSPSYTATRVALLEDKFEDWCGEDPNGNGFCPAEYYAPKFKYEKCHAVRSGNILEIYFPDNEKSYFEKEENDPNYQTLEEKIIWPGFAFISGCIWGDDSSLKIQYLDLSEVHNKILKREEKFGYIHLPRNLSLKEAIYLGGWEADCFPRIAIAHENWWDLKTNQKFE